MTLTQSIQTLLKPPSAFYAANKATIDAKDWREVTSQLNAQVEIDNPVTTIPKPVDVYALRELITDEEAFKILNLPIWDRITAALAQGDLLTVQNHVQALVAGGVLSLESVGKITPLFSETIPNPQSKILSSPIQQAGFDVVYFDDVVEAMD